MDTPVVVITGASSGIGEATAHELAAKLAAGPTRAYAAIKAQLHYAAASTLPEALDKEGDLQARMGATADHRNATAAFVRKERPVFTGR